MLKSMRVAEASLDFATLSPVSRGASPILGAPARAPTDTAWSRAPRQAMEADVEVSVEIDPDGRVSVTISDETGYNPEVVETMTRQAGDRALAVHQQLTA